MSTKDLKEKIRKKKKKEKKDPESKDKSNGIPTINTVGRQNERERESFRLPLIVHESCEITPPSK